MIEPTLNQYAPPTAEVADVQASTTGELKFFSSQGRIGRLRYLAYSTGASVIHSILTTVLTLALGGSTGPAAIAVTIVAFIALLWFSIITGIKRCHDIGISGWWSLTVIIPVIALIWIFVPGHKGENRFGPPPPPNTWGVRMLGLILPVVFFVGILAAIAIPAYQSYTLKARAAQAAAGQR